MRLFQVCADPGIAPDGTKGAAVHLRSLAAAMRRLGHEVTCFSRRPVGDPANAGAVLPLRDRETLLEAAGELGRPDLVYERYSLGHEEGLAAARALDRPFVLEVNAPLVAEARCHRPRSVRPEHARMEERLLREADLVVAVSHPLADIIRRVRGEARPTVVVPNGCDLPARPTAVDSDPPLLAFAGHPKPWHGADRLPEVVAHLLNSGHDVKLLIIGGGPGAEDVRAAASTLGVDDRVTVTGTVDHQAVGALLAGAAVGLAPYPAQDPFYFSPIKVVEYMAAGLPVVATAQGDITTTVADGGILVDPDDIDAFTAAVDLLLSDPVLRRQMGVAGRRRAAGLTWDAAADAIVAGAAALS